MWMSGCFSLELPGCSWMLLRCSWTLLGCSWTLLGCSWALLGCSWAPLGCSWTPLGCSWTVLGCSSALMGCSSALLGCSWAFLGCSCALPGCSWALRLRPRARVFLRLPHPRRKHHSSPKLLHSTSPKAVVPVGTPSPKAVGPVCYLLRAPAPLPPHSLCRRAWRPYFQLASFHLASALRPRCIRRVHIACAHRGPEGKSACGAYVMAHWLRSVR
jgi:hypothetical protein